MWRRLATLQQGLYAKWVRRGATNLAGPYASASYLDDLAWCGSESLFIKLHQEAICIWLTANCATTA